MNQTQDPDETQKAELSEISGKGKGGKIRRNWRGRGQVGRGEEEGKGESPGLQLPELA